MLLIGCSAAFAQTRSEIESNLSALEPRIQALSAQINHAQSQRDQLASELRDRELAVARWATTIARTTINLAAVQQRNQALGVRRDQVNGQLRQRRKALARYMRIGYMLGREHPLLWLLQQQSSVKISRLLGYQMYFSSRERNQILNIRRLLDELSAIDAKLRREQLRLTALHGQQQQAQQAQQQEQAQRAVLLARINDKLRSDNSAHQRLAEEAKRLNKLIADIDSVLSDIPGDRTRKLFANREGQLSWPISGQLKEAFHASSEPANLHHKGVLLQAPEGETIRAIHRGRVAYADWLSGFGLLVILDHGAGYMSLYGHAARINRDVGEWVDEGDPIALVGSTGGRSEAGLYFSIRHNGIASDPSRWCRPETIRS